MTALCLFLVLVAGEWGEVFAVLAVILGATSIWMIVGWNRKARYSLDVLRELHESGGSPPDDDDLPEVAEDAGVICLCCGEPYAAWLLVCPRCGPSSGCRL
jgi:hypothetical protein